MNGRLRRGLVLGLHAALSLAVLGAGAHFVRRLDIPRVGAALAAASLLLAAAAAAINLGHVVLRAGLLRALLAPVRRIRLLPLVRYDLGMFAANNLLPGRAGELVRIRLLDAREGVPISSSLAVSLVEKAFDAIALLLLALPVPFVLRGLPSSVRLAIGLLGAAGALGLAAAWALARFGQRREGRLQRFAAGMAVVRRGSMFASALGWTLAAHLADVAEIAVCMAALRIEAPPATPLLVLLGVAVALAVPSTPSGIGALELGAVGALHLVGVSGERALAFALIYHAIQALPVTLLGIDGMRLAAVARRASPEPGPKTNEAPP